MAGKSKKIGELTEAKVLVKMLEMGFICSKPHGDNAPYDLIVDNGQELTRIQIKTGRIEGNCVVFNAASFNKYVARKYTPDEIDAFVVFAPTIEKFYWISVDTALSYQVRMTLLDKGRRETSLKARDFEI